MAPAVNQDIVTFHPRERLIKVSPSAVRPDGTVIIDATKDIYSAWKRWAASEDGIVFGELVQAKGGIVLPSGFRTETHVILQDGWKIQCPNEAQTVDLYGNLHSSDASDPFVPRPDGHKVVINALRRKDAIRNKTIYFSSLFLLLIGIALLGLWIYCEPTQIEPYAAIAVALFTLVQFLGQGPR
jgi:hypothetical protein